MSMQNRNGPEYGSPPPWPDYLEPLRPDEVTRARLRRRLMSAAESILQRRSQSWADVTASWAHAIIPLAAGVFLVAGGLAYLISSNDAAAPGMAVEIPVETSVEPAGLAHELAPDAETPPALLIGNLELDRNAVLAAAMIQP